MSNRGFEVSQIAERDNLKNELELRLMGSTIALAGLCVGLLWIHRYVVLSCWVLGYNELGDVLPVVCVFALFAGVGPGYLGWKLRWLQAEPRRFMNLVSALLILSLPLFPGSALVGLYGLEVRHSRSGPGRFLLSEAYAKVRAATAQVEGRVSIRKRLEAGFVGLLFVLPHLWLIWIPVSG